MEKYINTVENAINAVHSKAWSDQPDSAEQYGADLLALIELRSFLESLGEEE